MIDFIRYFALDRERFLNKLEESEKIELISLYNNKTYVLNDFPKTAYYNNMFVKVTENQVSIEGSLHKYYNIIENFGKQNHNDFSYCDFKYALGYLQNTCPINNMETKVTNLEFGINIDIDLNPADLIDNYILMYDYKAPNRNEKFYGKGDYLEFKMSDYSIKIYNKSKQYSLKNRNILRVELKIVRSRYLKKHFGIYTLQDLDKKRFKLLFEKLLEHFDKLLIIDTLSLNTPGRIDEMILFQNGISHSYWKELTKNKTYKVKNRFKNDFNSILRFHSLLKTKKKLRNLLIDKFETLMNCNYEEIKIAA